MCRHLKEGWNLQNIQKGWIRIIEKKGIKKKYPNSSEAEFAACRKGAVENVFTG